MIRNLVSLLLARGGEVRHPDNRDHESQNRPRMMSDGMESRTSPRREATTGRLPDLPPEGLILMKVNRLKNKTVGVFSPNGPILEGRIVFMWVDLHPGSQGPLENNNLNKFRSRTVF